MKKLVLSLALVASALVVHAEKVRIGTVSVSGRPAFAEAVQRLSSMVGNPMLAGLLSGSLEQVSEQAVEFAIVADGDDVDFEKTSGTPTFASGELVRAKVGSDGIAAIAAMLERSAKTQGGAPVKPADLAVLKTVTGFGGSVFCTERGIDLRGRVAAADGSELSKVGLKALSADALAFAGKNAISAGANAANCGTGDQKATVESVLAVLKKNGVKTDFLQLDVRESMLKIVMDLPALVKYAEGEGAKTFAKLDPKAFMNEIRSAVPEQAFKAESPAYAASVAVKGFTPKYAAAQRWAKTLPEAAGKPVHTANVLSVYTIVKAVVPQVLATMPAQATAQLQPMVAALPEEGEGAIAGMGWREGDALCGLVRVSADELRGLGAVANVVMGAVMAQAMSAPATAGDED